MPFWFSAAYQKSLLTEQNQSKLTIMLTFLTEKKIYVALEASFPLGKKVSLEMGWWPVPQLRLLFFHTTEYKLRKGFLKRTAF